MINFSSLCIFLLWKRGLPRKLFLIFVNLVFHNWLPVLGLPPVECGMPRWGEPGWTIADCVIWSLSVKRLATIVGPELARWCTGDGLHDCEVMDRLLLLFIACAAATAADDDVCVDVLEWSVICAFGRLELDDDVYEEWREGDEVADAGDEGRNTAKNRLIVKWFYRRVI